VRDAKGEPVEVVGSWSDISARKAAEEAEDRARERLALLLETAPSVIYSFKASGDYAPTLSVRISSGYSAIAPTNI
jgi:adenylate cyclase